MNIANKLSLILFILIFLSGCSPVESNKTLIKEKTNTVNNSHSNEITVEQYKACEIPIANGVTLTPFEENAYRELKKRCLNNDACMVSCYANSKHRWTNSDGIEMYIAGGCGHICSRSFRSPK